MTIHFGDGTSISTEVAPSKVAQVVNATKTGAWAWRYDQNWKDVGITLNITPTAATSKIYLNMVVHASTRANSTDSLSNHLEARLQCNGSDIFIGTQADGTTDLLDGSYGLSSVNFFGNNAFNRVTAANGGRGNKLTMLCQNFLHSPNSTSQQQYTILIRRPLGSGYQFYLFGQRAYNGGAQAPSSLTAFEIRA